MYYVYMCVTIWLYSI